ncbi:MAG TPA: hypothetical protein VIL89_04405, partial [Clostridia bacterium]
MNKRLNGILLIILVLTMLFGANNFSFAAGRVYISFYMANDDDSIREGKEFDLDLKITNKSGADITDVNISFGANSSFQPSG